MKIPHNILSGLVCLLLFMLSNDNSYSQSARGGSFSIGAVLGVPISKYFSSTHSIGMGALAKFSFPVGEHSDITTGLKASSFLIKKDADKKGLYKQKNILSVLLGYKYNFNPGIERTFYAEPKLGLALIGTKHQALCYEPTVGYYFSKSFDLAIWYQSAASNSSSTNITAIGITASMNFNNLF